MSYNFILASRGAASRESNGRAFLHQRVDESRGHMIGNECEVQSTTQPPHATNLPAASRSTTARKFLWYLSLAPFLAL